MISSDLKNAMLLLSCRCNWEGSIKPFGMQLDEDDLMRISDTTASKGVLQQVYGLLPLFTTHITADSMQSFIGMRPGGVNPFTPKV
jgi:hypothetical protein